MAKKIDIADAPAVTGTLYPPPYDEPCRKRHRVKLGDAAGLTQFGVNLCTLPPGAWSSQRHWHTQEDELIYVVAGEVVLVTDDGEETLARRRLRRLQGRRGERPLLQNRSDRDVVILEIGTRIAGERRRFYSDIDMKTVPGKPGYAHRDGTPYPKQERRAAVTRRPRPFPLRGDGRRGPRLSAADRIRQGACRDHRRRLHRPLGGAASGRSAASTWSWSRPNRVGWGASGRNGGQLHSGQRRDQDWLEARFGRDDARRLWTLAEEAKALTTRSHRQARASPATGATG